MKNPRSITLTPELIQQHQLSTDPPPQDSLFWQLWNAAKPSAQQALATDFIQGIKSGTLNPVTYGAFNISDAYYCFHGAEDYGKAVARATDPVLKAFLQSKYQSYQDFNATFPTTWRISDASSIVPMQVTKEYSDFETMVATTYDPIYTLVAMLPCEYLWPWLSEQIGTPTPGNLYADWITGNGHSSGAFAMGNFLEAYRLQHPIDVAKATDIYTQAMQFEANNFATATS